MFAELKRSALFASAPFVLWMALMLLLPSSAWAYALRTAVSGAALLAAWYHFSRVERIETGIPRSGSPGVASSCFMGLLIGAAVAVLWIAPEYLAFYRRWFVVGAVPHPAAVQTSSYDPAVCGWPLTVLRLAGSAFVIAPAEELFFRAYLYRRLQSGAWREVDRRNFDLSAFLWTTALFALEHNRVAAAVAAGVFYLFAYRRFGFLCAMLAHVVTNLLLALFVLQTGSWAFW